MANEKIVNRENLKAFRQELDKRYAKPDGYYPTMTVGLADNLTPYGEDSGAEQENPFISNGTGTNNNTEIVTVGDYGLLQEKQGNTLVVNQVVKNPNFSSTDGYTTSNATLTINNNVGSLVATAQYGYLSIDIGTAINSHKYLLVFTAKSNVNNYEIETNWYGALPQNFTLSTSYNQFARIIDNTYQTGAWFVRFRDNHNSDFSTIDFKNIQLIDLTQMFGSNDLIPQDLLDNPSHFSWYYNGSLAYNTGTLVNANGVKLISTGRQLWDEQWELGRYNDTTGLPSSSTTLIRSKSTNPIRVIPNTIYYMKCINTSYVYTYDKNDNFIEKITLNPNATFTTPSNCWYIRFFVGSGYGTTYNNDITISLYYTPEQGGEGYSNYYQYEAPYKVDTGSEVLRSAGSVKEYKEPNGTIHRVVNSYTFTGSETWNVDNNYAYAIISNLNGKLSSQNIIGEVSAISKYQIGSSNGNVLAIYLDTTTYDTSAKINALTTGKTIYFEVATETTETGTPFAENLPINDYGMLYWLDENNELVGIPQGAKIFYPTNYKGFVDDMYSRVDGDSSQYVIQSELSASETQRDTIDTQLKNAIGGTLRQCLCVKESLDFDNTAFIDLKDTNLVYNSGWNCWTFVISNMKPATDNNTPAKVLCSLCKTVKASGYTSSHSNFTIAINANGQGFIDNGSSTIKPEGVLLAYEKA